MELMGSKTQRQGWKLNSGEKDEIILNVESHHAQAKVAGFIFSIEDCAYVKVIAFGIAVGVDLHAISHLTCDFRRLLHVADEQYEPMKPFLLR